MLTVYSTARLTGLQDTCWWSLTPLHRCSRCILQPSWLGYRTFVGGVLPFCRDAVGVFYSLADWATGHLLVESYPLQRCSRCILQPGWLGYRTLVGGVLPLCRDTVGVFYSPADWATGHLLVESYPSVVMQSVYSTNPAEWAKKF